MPLFSQKDLYNASNKPLSQSLFADFGGPISLSKIGVAGKINLYDLYMKFAVDDPTEMDFVDAVFGDVYFWSVLCEAPYFKRHLEEWRVLAAHGRKQKAFRIIVDEVKNNGKNAMAAAKYLIEEPWKLQTPVARKRKEIQKEIAESANSAMSSFQADVERLKQDGVLN